MNLNRVSNLIYTTFCAIFLTTALWCTPLHADSQPLEATEKAAFEAFDHKAFQKAYELFLQIEMQTLQDPDIQYFFGRSAFESGHYRDAVIAYERVLILRPNDLAATLELARTYFVLHNDTDAKRLFRSALKRKLPKNVERKIRFYLEQIDNRRSKQLLYGSFSVGFGYDSNVYNRAQFNYLYLPGNILISNTVADKWDTYHTESLQVGHIYDFGEEGGWALKNQFYIYWQTMSRYSSKNIYYFNYMPSLLYQHAHTLYSFGLGIDRMLYGSDPYMQSWFFIPSAEYYFSPTDFLKASMTYQERKSKGDQYPRRDSRYAMFSLLWHTKVAENLTLEPAVAYIREKKVHSTLTDVTHKAWLAKASATWEVDTNYELGMDLGYKYIDYDEKDFFFQIGRNDRYYEGIVRFARKFPERYRAELEAGYLYNRSHIPIYEYRKHFFNFNLIKEF